MRRFGVSYILGIKGNTIIPLKGGKEDSNKYFSSKELGKRSIGGKGVYFDESTLNLKTFGQQRVFMVKPSDTSEPRFFITDIRKSKPETIMAIAKRRWDDEQGHKDLKQYCGFCKRWTRKPNMQRIHINLSYYLYNALSVVRSSFTESEEDLSIGKITKQVINFSESLIRPIVDFEAFYYVLSTFGGLEK